MERAESCLSRCKRDLRLTRSLRSPAHPLTRSLCAQRVRRLGLAHAPRRVETRQQDGKQGDQKRLHKLSRLQLHFLRLPDRTQVDNIKLI